jgi:beta-N-acetylhexosaminidase
MIDLEGIELNAQDRERLLQPACAGVILFTRNYQSPEQLRALCADIKSMRDPGLLIAVDHEGGRVQRFREGFSVIPAMRTIGALWDQDRHRANLVAHDAGRVIATELGACGIDFSFAPVLDVDHGCSSVIGDRAFHASTEAVIELAQAFVSGLNQCGMIAVGKHFPGHGAVAADTHHDVAVDHRELADIERDDLPPFIALCQGALAGVMPAHVVYEKVDAQPAGFSRFWLRDVLRDRIGFKGVVFSDDLSMRAACVAGDAAARAGAAFAAGCDVALVCNAPDDADAVLHAMRRADGTLEAARLLSLHRRHESGSLRHAATEVDYLAAQQRLAGLQPERADPAT